MFSLSLRLSFTSASAVSIKGRILYEGDEATMLRSRGLFRIQQVDQHYQLLKKIFEALIARLIATNDFARLFFQCACKNEFVT